ncbi:MAG TPA: CaiB/BaiF CoA-transferase family protein [Methylibium sp.]|jgi:formyl-CoA transferase|nr:CaiB/BaiF CoA-transferase family protein [Methylibium sp.]
MQIFEGLKVIDAAGFIAAPGAATILSDFGAEVVKIEPPGEGDGFRKVFRIPNQPVSEHNYLWMQVARNRRALALDLKQAEGRAVLHRLAASADVLITNYPPHQRARLGLAWEQIEPLNPRLVYASLTGYGETGPEADKPGFDATTYWARSGLADLTRPDPDGPPANPANGLGDQPTAGMLFGAIVTALYRRERTGRGGRVTTSLLSNGAWANAMQIQAALVGGDVVYRQPRSRPRNALTNFYRCADGRWFILSLISEERDWPNFAPLVGLGHLRDDVRFATLAQRRAHAAELTLQLDGAFAQRDSVAWQALFEAAGHTVGLVARTADVVTDEQMRLCGALIEADGIPGTGLTVDSPFRIDGEAKTRPQPAPAVGQHSDAVLRDAGFDAEQIARLRQAGVVA